MWARVIESMLGCWLALSPFVFSHGDAVTLWIIDFSAASAVILFALLSYWKPTRHVHLITVVVAAALIVYGRFATGGEPGPAHQNYIMIGLLLLMFAIIPNWASTPPASWLKRETEQPGSTSS